MREKLKGTVQKNVVCKKHAHRLQKSQSGAWLPLYCLANAGYRKSTILLNGESQNTICDQTLCQFKKFIIS